MDTDEKLIVQRAPERLAAFMLFVIFVSLGVTFIVLCIINIINRPSWGSALIFFLFFLTCTSFSVFYCNQTFKKRDLFEINTEGIKLANDTIIPWDNMFQIELEKFPSSGLSFIYYLIGPKGLSFYQIIIYEDYLLKKKRRIIFSSYINTSWEKINDIVIYYSIKNNVNFS